MMKHIVFRHGGARPVYTNLGQKNRFPTPHNTALTATADKATRKDISKLNFQSLLIEKI
jgi:superfamily II DNA helicase RecQ